MNDIIVFQEKKYLCRWVSINGEEYLIADETLEDDLLTKECNYVSDEAKAIDEEIFFYVPPRIIADRKADIGLYVENAVRCK